MHSEQLPKVHLQRKKMLADFTTLEEYNSPNNSPEQLPGNKAGVFSGSMQLV